MNKMSLKKIFGMKSFLIVFLAILVLFAFNFFKEYNRNRQLNKEIKKLEEVANELEAKNLDILEVAKYLDTEEFLENEARTKLGLKKPGETAVVVSIPGMTGTVTDSMDVVQEDEFNPYEWWKYFFEKKS